MENEARLEKAAELITRLAGEYTGAITAGYWQMGKEYLAKEAIENCSVLKAAKTWIDDWIDSKGEGGK